MKSDTKELKRLAQKATPGPWAQRVGHGSVWSCALETLGIRVCVCDADDYDGGNDEEAEAQANATAAYIAAANPQAVMALIERLEKLEEAVKGAHVVAEQAGEVLRANKGTVRLTLEQALNVQMALRRSKCLREGSAGESSGRDTRVYTRDLEELGEALDAIREGSLAAAIKEAQGE